MTTICKNSSSDGSHDEIHCSFNQDEKWVKKKINKIVFKLPSCDAIEKKKKNTLINRQATYVCDREGQVHLPPPTNWR